MEFEVKRLWITESEKAKQEWTTFLEIHGLHPEKSVEHAYGVFHSEKMIATGSIFQNIIKLVAIDDEYRDGSTFNKIISFLMSEIVYNQYENIYVYTKMLNKKAFEHLGFREIEHVDDSLVFMEKAVNGFESYINELSKEKKNGSIISSIVMNANPFTLGHQFLIEEASKASDVVHVFVVSDEQSVFPKKDRKMLVEKGIHKFNNVFLHETNNYIVSSQTFPSYFLNESQNVTEIQANLDAKIFKNHIAPALGITIRYVGEEPTSVATNIYNMEMGKVFSSELELRILPRVTVPDGRVVSASIVRNLLSEGKLADTKIFLPDFTYTFLKTPEGQKIIERLKKEKKEV